LDEEEKEEEEVEEQKEERRRKKTLRATFRLCFVAMSSGSVLIT